jgi:hypothetical protein
MLAMLLSMTDPAASRQSLAEIGKLTQPALLKSHCIRVIDGKNSSDNRSYKRGVCPVI